MINRFSTLFLLATALIIQGCSNIPLVGAPNHEMSLNGIGFTEVPRFPDSAWQGLPSIKSTDDLRNIAKIASLMAKTSVTAAQKGNADLSVASWFWYRQYAGQALSVMESSIKAIDSMNGKSGGASVPGNSLVVLPSFSRHGNPNGIARLVSTEPVIEYQGVMLAGGGSAALSDALNQMLAPKQEPNMQRQRDYVAELPVNTPVRLNNGLYLERRDDALVVYNPNVSGVELPLKDLNYIPSIPEPGKIRKNATPYMYAMRDAVYKTMLESMGFTTIAPPSYVTVGTISKELMPLNGTGHIARNRQEAEAGKRNYQTNPSYKISVDLLAKIPAMPAVNSFNTKCKMKGYGYIYDFKGEYAEILRTSCASGSATIYSQDFYVTGDATIQTYDSMASDHKIIRDMEREVAKADAVDNALSFVPVIGNIENALQCAGVTSGAQYLNLMRISGNTMNVAKMAGWKPTEASMADTAINCVGAIPVIGDIGHVARAVGSGAKALNKVSLASKSNKYGEMLDIFRTTSDLEKASSKAAALFPENKGLAMMLSKGYNITQTSVNAHQTADGFEKLYTSYANDI